MKRLKNLALAVSCILMLSSISAGAISFTEAQLENPFQVMQPDYLKNKNKKSYGERAEIWRRYIGIAEKSKMDFCNLKDDLLINLDEDLMGLMEVEVMLISLSENLNECLETMRSLVGFYTAIYRSTDPLVKSRSCND